MSVFFQDFLKSSHCTVSWWRFLVSQDANWDRIRFRFLGEHGKAEVRPSSSLKVPKGDKQLEMVFP